MLCQIIANSHDRFFPNGGLVGEIHYFIIWPDGVEHLSPNFYRVLDGSFRRLPRVPGSLVLVRLKAAMKYRLNTWWLWRQIFGKTHGMSEKNIPRETKENHRKNRNTHRKAWVFFEKKVHFWLVCLLFFKYNVYYSISPKRYGDLFYWHALLKISFQGYFWSLWMRQPTQVTHLKRLGNREVIFEFLPPETIFFFCNDFSELISTHLHVI